MEFHEVANIFPLLVGDEYESFKADIAKNGQLESIWVYDNTIIDGRNRYRACVDLGIEPKFRQWEGDGSLVAFVVSLNARRRQLSTGQKAACAVLLLPALEAEAKKRQGYRSDLDGILPQGETGRSSEIAGEMLGVSDKYVRHTKKIFDEAPETFNKLFLGDISLPQAKRELQKKQDQDLLLNYEIDDNDLYENYAALAWAVVRRAVLQAVEFPDSSEPRDWILGDTCRWYCEKLGKSHDLLQDWVLSGCMDIPLHLQLLKILDAQGV